MQVDRRPHHFRQVHNGGNAGVVVFPADCDVFRTDAKHDFLLRNVPRAQQSLFFFRQAKPHAVYRNGISFPAAQQLCVEEIHLRRTDEPCDKDIRRIDVYKRQTFQS